ncbi:uncharacterized protein [Dysidea avara]|uniref:uncharacterized protein isoform X3 n=1 Tax=Dysidea avara TaxID=196820 RepID=UPI00332E273D
MAAAPSDDDMPQCPLCHMTLGSKNELQLHYLQSCSGYDNPEASGPMNVGVRQAAGPPVGMRQNYGGGGGGGGGGGYDGSSDRRPVPSSSDDRFDRSSRAAVSGGDEPFSGLSQHLVRFVWFPSDPFKIKENKVTLLSSFTAGGGTVELFKSNGNDVSSFASSNVSVRLGTFSDGQIVCGDDILQIEQFEVSADSEEVYLITKDNGQPGPPPAAPTTGGVPPTHGDRNFGVNQFGAPPKQPQYTPSHGDYHGGDHFSPPIPQQFGRPGDRTAVAGADTGGYNYKPQYGGRNASSFTEDTGASGILQNFDNTHQFRQPAASQMPTSPPVPNLYSSPSGHSQYVPQSSPGVSQRLPVTSEPTIPPSGDVHTLMNMKKSSGLPSSGRNSDEMVLQPAVVSQDYYPSQHSGSSIEQVVVPSTTSPTFSRNNFDRSTPYSGKETAHPILDTTPYGRDRHVAAAASHQDVGQSSSDAYGGANVITFMGKERNIGTAQKPGIDLQKLHGVEDTATQGKIRELEEQLQSKQQEKNEVKRTMERANAVLNNRIRRLEDQLKTMPSSTGGSNEAAMVEEIRKLNMKIAELESAEHMMKESTAGQDELERHHQQQIQELERRNNELKLQVANLEEICRMQQGEALEDSKKEIEHNKAVIAQLQSQMQENDIRYKQVASSLEDAHQKQTDLLEESRAAMTKSMELTEENAKLHEQNFNLSEDLKSLTAKLQQQGGGGAMANDEEVATLKKESARLKIQAENAEREQQMLEQKNYALAAELQRLREVQESGAATETNTQETEILRAENAKLNTTVQTLQMQQTSYQATHQEMTQKISSIEAENLSLQQQVTGLKTSQYRLQQQVNSTEQEKKTLNEQLRQLQLTAGSGATSSEVSSLQQQLQQITQERDSAKRQMQSMEHFKTLLEDENMRQKETISKLQSQVSTDKGSTSEETTMLQVKLASAEEALQNALNQSSTKDTTINDLHANMLEIKNTRAQLENEVAAMREEKEKLHMENAQLREMATQPTKYQKAMEENKQLTRDNQELGTALERAQKELQLFKENSMALTEQLDKATDQATLDAITGKMTKYKGERDDARAQVQQLQEQLRTQGGGGGELASKAARYRQERNVLQEEVAKLNTIIAQMASAKASQPTFGNYTRQFSTDDPSSPTGDVLASLSDHSVTSEVSQYSATSYSDMEKVSHIVPAPTNQNYQSPSKLPKGPQGPRKIPTASSSHTASPSSVKKPTKRSSKSIIKQATTSTSGEKTPVCCEPVTSVSKGQRVVVGRSGGDECGTVRVVNVTIGAKTGFVGIEMDLPSGSSDGEVKGVRHFTWTFLSLKSL